MCLNKNYFFKILNNVPSECFTSHVHSYFFHLELIVIFNEIFLKNKCICYNKYKNNTNFKSLLFF